MLGLLTVVLLAACDPHSSPPLSIDDSVLVPQEQNEYVVIRDGMVIGRAYLTTRRIDPSGGHEGGWRFDYDFVYGGPDGDLSEVADFTQAFVTPRFMMRASNGGIDRPEERSTRFDVRYADGLARWDRWTAHDDRHERGVATVPAGTYDLNSSFWLWRTVPLGEGFEASYATFDPQALTTSTVRLEVAVQERIDVPAGRFTAWRLDVRQGDSTQTAWVDVASAQRLLQWTEGELLFRLSSTSLVDDRDR